MFRELTLIPPSGGCHYTDSFIMFFILILLATVRIVHPAKPSVQKLRVIPSAAKRLKLTEYRAYHLKCNPTSITYYGTKNQIISRSTPV